MINTKGFQTSLPQFFACVIQGGKAKIRGKKSGQGFLNKKMSTYKIWVSFQQKKKKSPKLSQNIVYHYLLQLKEETKLAQSSKT